MYKEFFSGLTHPVFAVAIQKSFHLLRENSYYRTTTGEVVCLSFRVRGQDAYFQFGVVIPPSNGVEMRFTYRLFLSGKCEVDRFLCSPNPLSTNFPVEVTQTDIYSRSIVLREGDNCSCVCPGEELDTIQRWLEAPKTSRFSPLNPGQLLPEEMTVDDLRLAIAASLTRGLGQDLGGLDLNEDADGGE